jgi:hypothetical protein
MVVADGDGGEAVAFSNVTVEYVAGQIYIVRGQTQPGVNVSCAGKQTMAGSGGHFELQVAAPRGAREVTLEAAGTQGARGTHRVALQQ